MSINDFRLTLYRLLAGFCTVTWTGCLQLFIFLKQLFSNIFCTVYHSLTIAGVGQCVTFSHSSYMLFWLTHFMFKRYFSCEHWIKSSSKYHVDIEVWCLRHN